MTRSWGLFGIFISLFSLGTSIPAHAREFYLDVGGGVSQIAGASPFFDTSDGSAANMLTRGIAGTVTLAVDLSRAQSLVHFHLGIQHKYLLSASQEASYTLQATYPLVRLHVSRIYLSVGATPFIWKDANAGYFKSAGAIAALGELGFLFPITPEIAFGVHAAGQVISKSGSLSPYPALDLGAFFRFYLNEGGGGSGASRGSTGDYKGWRYFYGIER